MYFTRSRVANEHKAAGVLPFSIHEGAVVVLLGAEPCRTGPGGRTWKTMWRDFGGSREAADADSAATAAREFSEETLGLFCCCSVDEAAVRAAAAAMAEQLRGTGHAVKVVHALQRGAYHFYCTQTPWVSPLMFRLATQQNTATRAVAGAEKSAFAWVPLAALLECVAVPAPRYFLETRAHVCGGPGTPPAARCGRRCFQLHPCFASSLRMAQKCGLEELVAQAHELPLPPPPPLVHLLVHAESTLCNAATAALEPDDSAAAAAEAADSKACGGSSCTAAVGSAEASLAYWLAQEGIGAALRGTSPSEASAEAATAADLPSGILLPKPPTQQQQRPGTGQRRQAARRGAGTALQPPFSPVPALAAPPCAGPATQLQPAASGSSLGPSSSLDTSSSLRQHRELVAAAAVEQVVCTIQQNALLAKKTRLSRKQRQNLRRRRQRAAEAAAAAQPPVGDSPVFAAASGPRLEKREQRPVHPSSSDAPASAPLHWLHAMRELDAAFQPGAAPPKRLRLVCE